MLKDICFVQDSVAEAEAFIGLRFEDGKPNVYFPRGYSLSESDHETRNDIISLLSVLKRFSEKKYGEKDSFSKGTRLSSFPVISYLYIINDFLSNGYYIETEVYHQIDRRGKIDWKRTIQNSKPIFDDKNPVFLSFVIKQSRVNESCILTKIHEYCVYESFMKLGWLYTNFTPKKPSVSPNKKLFLSVLRKAHNNTFNQDKKRLFSSMINVISNTSEEYDSKQNDAYGVFGFEYVWENLINYVFGEDNKEDYFPHTFWQLADWDSGDFRSNKKVNSPLEPDTIVLHNNAAFIIDAKYYQYGISNEHDPKYLPGTSSIQKQITYGEYVETLVENHNAVAKNIANGDSIYNAFIVPFNKGNSAFSNYKVVGVGTADWKQLKPKNYVHIIGVLLDTKHIITTYSRKSKTEISTLSNLIVTALQRFKDQQ